jgi:hypothetical protein
MAEQPNLLNEPIITTAMLADAMSRGSTMWTVQRVRRLLKKTGAWRKLGGQVVTDLALLREKCPPAFYALEDHEERKKRARKAEVDMSPVGRVAMVQRRQESNESTIRSLRAEVKRLRTAIRKSKLWVDKRIRALENEQRQRASEGVTKSL